MSEDINGWPSMDYATANLSSGDNIPVSAQYLVLVPQADGDRVVGFEVPNGRPDLSWMMEVANGDPTGTMDIDLIAGTPSSDEIFVPGGNSKVTLAPGRAQRMAYISGTGWVTLFNGALVA